MGICPVDFKPCCDDICYGAGCLRTRGAESILTRCDGCGCLVSMDGSSNVFECECEAEPLEDDPCGD